MNRFILVALAGVISGALITTQFTEPLIAQETKRVKSTYENLDLFGDIFERIRSSYVEEIDEEKLIESAISGMLSSLDPHSSYMAPEDFSTMQVQTRGEFGGLGIEVTQENGFIKVVSPIDDTPAANAGIEAGDFITKVVFLIQCGVIEDDDKNGFFKTTNGKVKHTFSFFLFWIHTPQLYI